MQKYEELARDCRLSDQQKCETVLRYVAPTHQDLWKTLDEFRVYDWNGFRRALSDIYVNTASQRWYAKQKLVEFVESSSRSHMNDEDDVLQYYCRFLILLKPLDSRCMNEEVRDKAFWRGFHPDDRRAMTSRLIAMNPYQRQDEAFHYQDVFKVARAVFTGPHKWQDQWYEPVGRRNKNAERWVDFEDEDPRELVHIRRTREREPQPFGRQPRERHHEGEPFRTATPDVETKVLRLKNPLREGEDKEVDELLDRMDGLSLRDREYATLYARFAYRYPDVAKYLHRPELERETPAAVSSFGYQAPPPQLPPAGQPWSPASASTQPESLPPPFINDASTYFRFRTKGCAFCTQEGHRVRQCSAAKEYVASGRAIIQNDRIHLPNGQPVPNDASGRGIKGNIDNWLAAQFPSQPAPQQPAAIPSAAASGRIVEVL